MNAIRSLFLSFLILASAPALSAGENMAPDALVRDVMNEVLSIVRADDAIRGGDTQRVVDLVEAKVLPHFDFRRMTMLAVGRDWRQASAAQQDELMDAFRTLLVRTYSNALTQYRNQEVEFRPFRMAAGDTTARVQTEVKQAGAQPVNIDYALGRTDAGWKVFDVVVAGVSLVTNYRGTFSQEIRTGGIDGLIRSLQAKNRELKPGPART